MFVIYLGCAKEIMGNHGLVMQPTNYMQIDGVIARVHLYYARSQSIIVIKKFNLKRRRERSEKQVLIA